MLSRVIERHVISTLRCVPFSVIRYFAASDPTPKPKLVKIPIDPKEYTLKRANHAHGCAPKPNLQQPQDKDKDKFKRDKEKTIGMYRKGKVVEYEWVDPKPGDTNLNPDYDKVDAPNKANYVFKEYGYKIKGPEPTRYFDWERHGRVTDF